MLRSWFTCLFPQTWFRSWLKALTVMLAILSKLCWVEIRLRQILCCFQVLLLLPTHTLFGYDFLQMHTLWRGGGCNSKTRIRLVLRPSWLKNSRPFLQRISTSVFHTVTSLDTRHSLYVHVIAPSVTNTDSLCVFLRLQVRMPWAHNWLVVYRMNSPSQN
jgi:hypothetical protein